MSRWDHLHNARIDIKGLVEWLAEMTNIDERGFYLLGGSISILVIALSLFWTLGWIKCKWKPEKCDNGES